MAIGMDIKKLFFDRPKIKRAVDKAKRGVLSRAGAFIRQTARTSIRKRKGTSPPGSPPHSHLGLLRRFILFGYDERTDSVVVGPAKLAKAGDAPHTLEFGGAAVAKRTMVVRVGDTGRDRRGRFARGKRQLVEAGTRLVYKPRPYMGPAMKKELPKFPQLWRNSIRSG